MNYAFDESEFVRKVDEAANLVKKHHVFRETTTNHEEERVANDKCALPGDWNKDTDDDNSQKILSNLRHEL